MTIVAGIFAFFGAGLGSAFAFWASRGATRAEREARRREEWGRRFTTALGALTSADSVTRFAGRALLRELLESELASEDDRKAAEAVLAAIATHNNRDQEVAVPPGDLDDVDIVQDNGDDPELGGAQE
jgi:hypothetical protein